MTGRWVIPIAAVSLVLGLTACGARSAPASQTWPETAAPSTPAAVTTPVATPSTDPLADIDRQLATVDGAAAQSQGDLAAGDAAASASDDGQ
ncbi:hypothetical protein ACVXZ4_06035 [Lacisediminihabitans sp. FW035]